MENYTNHELLDRAYIIATFFEEYILNHPSKLRIRDRHRLSKELYQLYQDIGSCKEEWLMPKENINYYLNKEYFMRVNGRYGNMVKNKNIADIIIKDIAFDNQDRIKIKQINF